MATKSATRIIDSQTASRRAHEFASEWLAKYGRPADAMSVCRDASQYVPEKYRELFVERSYGHFANAEFGAGM